MRKYFGTDGIRGKANVYPMTVDFALKLGQALAQKVLATTPAPHQIVIGKDTRLSCYMYESALVAGICSQGVDAVVVGPMPTPAVAFITRSVRANAGAVISASHNPYYDNGIKFFDAEGYKLPDDMEEELEAIVDGGPVPLTNCIGKTYRISTADGRYVEFVKSTFDKELDLRNLKVVVDCANGAGYKVAPMAIEELGAEIIVINNEPNGININENSGATAPSAMAKKVVELCADIGISFDGDGDRLIVCDHEGNIVDGDLIMAICGIHMKKHGQLAKNTIVATVMSNQGFVQSLKKHGIEVVRANVGDRYVLEAMRNGGYNLGGEQSGHLIFLDYNTTGDGLISALQLLKVLVKEKKSLKELAAQIDIFPQVLENVMVAAKPPLEKLKKTTTLITTINEKLGDAGRVLVRYSGTESKLRVMVEGADLKQITDYAKEITALAVNEIESI